MNRRNEVTQATNTWAVTDLAACEARARSARNEYLAAAMIKLGQSLVQGVQDLFSAPARTRDA